MTDYQFPPYDASDRGYYNRTLKEIAERHRPQKQQAQQHATHRRELARMQLGVATNRAEDTYFAAAEQHLREYAEQYRAQCRAAWALQGRTQHAAAYEAYELELAAIELEAERAATAQRAEEVAFQQWYEGERKRADAERKRARYLASERGQREMAEREASRRQRAVVLEQEYAWQVAKGRPSEMWMRWNEWFGGVWAGENPEATAMRERWCAENPAHRAMMESDNPDLYDRWRASALGEVVGRPDRATRWLP